MKIGLRTVKTALGAGVSIWIAELLHLQFSSFAAIICILCIEKTKKQSIRSSLDRLAACTLSLVLSGLVFQTLGFNPLVFSLFIMLFIPLLVQLRLQKGFVNSVVIVLHVFTLEKFTFPIALNELLIVIIGVGVAILFNIYMPNLEKNLKETKLIIEEKFKKILFEYGAYLEKDDQGWDGKELLELEKDLNKGKMLAIQYEENQLGSDKKGYYYYFDMREKQFVILERMLPIVSSLNEDVVQRHVFAQFLYEISSDVKSENTAYKHLQRLEIEHQKMKEMDLPKSRTEFETRALVFHLMNEMEYYLETKMNYYDEKQINV